MRFSEGTGLRPGPRPGLARRHPAAGRHGVPGVAVAGRLAAEADALDDPPVRLDFGDLISVPRYQMAGEKPLKATVSFMKINDLEAFSDRV